MEFHLTKVFHELEEDLKVRLKVNEHEPEISNDVIKKISQWPGSAI
jgi:hypothetical protein